MQRLLELLFASDLLLNLIPGVIVISKRSIHLSQRESKLILGKATINDLVKALPEA